MRTSYQQARLDGMAQGFGVDVEPAQHLSGPELDCWLDHQEDELFAVAMAELATMRTERLTWPRPGRLRILCKHGIGTSHHRHQGGTPPASIRERLARLKAEIVGAVAGSTAGAGA